MKKVLVAIADENGTLLECFVVKVPEEHAEVKIVGRAGAEVRDYIERRYNVIDKW